MPTVEDIRNLLQKKAPDALVDVLERAMKSARSGDRDGAVSVLKNYLQETADVPPVASPSPPKEEQRAETVEPAAAVGVAGALSAPAVDGAVDVGGTAASPRAAKTTAGVAQVLKSFNVVAVGDDAP
jgi:hypothetical protein